MMSLRLQLDFGGEDVLRPKLKWYRFTMLQYELKPVDFVNTMDGNLPLTSRSLASLADL